MRYLVLVLMIALLPLRGWAGDVMAVEMASHSTSHLVAINSGAIGAHEMLATTSLDDNNQVFHDCHGVIQDQTGGDRTAIVMDDGHGSTCQACQACHTVALSPSVTVMDGFLHSAQLLPTSATSFTSAFTALGQKPPIP